MEIFRKDLQLAVRTLLKSPGFAAIAVLTLTLGIAVNATMFSLVSAFLLRRPPCQEPERIAVVSSIDPTPGFESDTNPVSAPNYLAWREANHVFTDMAAAEEHRSVSLNLGNRPLSIYAAVVTASYFNVLGVKPQLGRTFDTGEDLQGRDRVAILSYGLWEQYFASDTHIPGQTVRINRELYTIIGVMPKNFKLLGYTPQLWIPLVLNQGDQTAAAHKNRTLHVFARLKPGVTLEQAGAEMATLARRTQQDFPDTEKQWGAAVRTLPDFLIYDFGIRSVLALTMTVVGFVLMIACTNVAGLLLARVAGRQREISIRLALGAGRLRIIRQLLTEGLLIAMLGLGLGLLLTYWGVRFVQASMTFNEAFSAVTISLDSNVLIFAAVTSLISAALCGLAPSLKASRTDITSNLKDESHGSSGGRSHSRLRTIMVTGQVAVALFLLVGTGILFRGIFLIEHQNLGFRSDHLLTANATLDAIRYKDPEQQTAFIKNLLPVIQKIADAESVAVTSDLPATGPGSVSFQIKGQPESATKQDRNALDIIITPDYLRTARVTLLRGRTFTDFDTATKPRVVMVNEEFVRRYLSDGDPLGKQIRMEIHGTMSDWSEIIGVTGNVKTFSETTLDDPQIYEAYMQRPVSSFSLMVRTTSEPNLLGPNLRKAVSQVDADLPLARVMSMTGVIDRQKAGNPFFVRTLGTFAVLALLLASVGIYGLIAYTVDQRKREIGIRMALGARRSDVRRMILIQGLKLAIIGSAIGLVLALPLPKVFGALFYDLQIRAAWFYIIVPVTILAVSLVAVYVPARRAAQVEPNTALRNE